MTGRHSMTPVRAALVLGVEQSVLRGFLQFDWGNIEYAAQDLIYVWDVEICRDIWHLKLQRF